MGVKRVGSPVTNLCLVEEVMRVKDHAQLPAGCGILRVTLGGVVHLFDSGTDRAVEVIKSRMREFWQGGFLGA